MQITNPSLSSAVAAVLLLQCGDGLAAAPIYRCIDDSGRVLFSQFVCSRGQGERLRPEVPKVGWQAAVSRASAPAPVGDRGAERRPRERGQESSTRSRQGCWKARQRLKWIARQLREGYRRSEGERLRRQRIEREAYLSRFCQPLSSSSR